MESTSSICLHDTVHALPSDLCALQTTFKIFWILLTTLHHYPIRHLKKQVSNHRKRPNQTQIQGPLDYCTVRLCYDFSKLRQADELVLDDTTTFELDLGKVKIWDSFRLPKRLYNVSANDVFEDNHNTSAYTDTNKTTHFSLQRTGNTSTYLNLKKGICETMAHS